MSSANKPGFGQRLRHERESRNWTQEQLAEEIGGSVPSIHRWENDEAFPRAYLREKLYQVFEKTSDTFGVVAQGPLFWKVPYLRNPYFTGRDAVLTHLHTALYRDYQAALTHTYAISGLGGIGKTQVALEYAYRYAHEYKAVLWMRADTREALLADFFDLLILLNLPEKEELNPSRAVKAVHRWFRGQTEWLLLLDNADDIKMLSEFLPSGSGSILLTTRAQATGNRIKKFELEKWSRDEGIAFLLRRMLTDESDQPAASFLQDLQHDAEVIYTLLDGLPLALDQAAAYVEENGCSLADYLALYQKHRTVLLRHRGALSEDEYPRSVATTWELSFQQLEQQQPIASALLCLCVFLHPDAIAESTLVEGATALQHASLRAIGDDPLLFNNALGALRHYSLIRRNAQTKVVSIHRLVQVVLKEQMSPEMQRAWAEEIVRLLHRVFPDPEQLTTWKKCQQYFPHIQVCMEVIKQYHIVSPEAIQLLRRAAIYLQKRGQYTQAATFLHLCLVLAEETCSQDDPVIAQICNDLGVQYWEQSKYDQAEQFLQRSLALKEVYLNPNDPSLAQTLNDLALVYSQRERTSEAFLMYQRALTIWRQTYDVEHNAIAECLNNLALLLLSLKQYAEAEQTMQQALTIWEHILEPEHPTLAAACDNMAMMYFYLGNYLQAEELMKRALTMREECLGMEHPDNANSLNNLGVLARHQKKFDEAEQLLKQALAIREQALGPEHDDVANSLFNLAKLYQDLGRNEEAKSFYVRTLSLNEKIFGKEHSETLAMLEVYQIFLRQTEYDVPEG